MVCKDNGSVCGKLNVKLLFFIKQWFTEQIPLSLNKLNSIIINIFLGIKIYLSLCSNMEPFYITISLQLTTDSKLKFNYYLFFKYIN